MSTTDHLLQLKTEVSTQLAITSPGSTHGTSDQIQLLIPSQHFHVDDPHAEVLILGLSVSCS
jgi:hypothetical protein